MPNIPVEYLSKLVNLQNMINCMYFTPDSKTDLMKDELKFLNDGHLETDKGDKDIIDERSSSKRLRLGETSAGNKKPAKIIKVCKIFYANID